VSHSSKATCGGMVYSDVELMVVLVNLAPSGRRGESCTSKSGFEGGYVGASRFGRRPYADLRVQLTEGRRMHNYGCGDVLSSRAPTASGMVLQCSGW
jgi:hypothetical protein